jgi:hypothetical protein
MLPRGSSSRIIDLTDSVPGYGGSTEGLVGLEKRIRAECMSTSHRQGSADEQMNQQGRRHQYISMLSIHWPKITRYQGL